MNNLVKRSISGLVYVAIILFCTVYGGYYFMALAILLAIGGTVELQKLYYGDTHIHPWVSAVDVAAAAIPVLTIYFPWCGWLFLVYFICRMFMVVFVDDDKPSLSLGGSALGLLYVALPVTLMAALSYYSRDGMAIVLATFILIWLSDTGAYCVGSMIGKHPFAPKISPKKSWEGFFGGVFFCVVASLVMKYCFPASFPFPLSFMLAMGILVPVTGSVGDLVESRLKRAAGVKDSGNIIPGHGGVLDRIDSLLLVAPTVALLYIFLLF